MGSSPTSYTETSAYDNYMTKFSGVIGLSDVLAKCVERKPSPPTITSHPINFQQLLLESGMLATYDHPPSWCFWNCRITSAYNLNSVE